jgi:hypothetical protein
MRRVLFKTQEADNTLSFSGQPCGKFVYLICVVNNVFLNSEPCG